MRRSFMQVKRGSGPLVATAIHNGHAVREEIAGMLLLGEAERLREEDPFTGELAVVADTRVVANVSRFEVDLNRPRAKAVYRTPEESWGITVWKRELPDAVVMRSLREYDDFYAVMRELFKALEKRYDRFVVFDLHSYNYRRQGPSGPEADPSLNPEINIGTGTMNRQLWARVIDRVKRELSGADFLGGKLDVRENVKFKGGYFPLWVHENFPDTGCAIAIEFKKIFMDEWTGEIYPDRFDALRSALRMAANGVLEELEGDFRGEARNE